jgi:hypothetical protein
VRGSSRAILRADQFNVRRNRPVAMTSNLRIRACALLIAVCGASASAAVPQLDVKCLISGEDYVVTLSNPSDAPVAYFLTAADSSIPAFRAVPWGAEVFISRPPYVALKSLSSLQVQNDSLKTPVHLETIYPHVRVERRFKLRDLWWPWVNADSIPVLTSSRAAFMLRIRVYADDGLIRFVECNTEWKQFVK